MTVIGALSIDLFKCPRFFNAYAGITYTFVKAIGAMAIDSSKCSRLVNVHGGIIYTGFGAIAAMPAGLVNYCKAVVTALTWMHS